MSDKKNGLCNICKSETKSKCSNCNQVFYCSREHQKSDWKSHKKSCHPFKICENEHLGRHLISTREIKPYEILIKESPLVRGPSQVTGPVCLGCLNIIDEKNYVPCSKCGWPLCSKSCEGADEHNRECILTQNRSQKKVNIQYFTAPHPMYQFITTLRGLLLKQRDSTAFEKLNRLESHENIRRGSAQWKSDLQCIGKFIPSFFQTNEFSEGEIMRMTGILQINGHEVPTTEPPHVAVFEMSSLVEHSCCPNLAKSFTKDGGLVLWAPQTIPKNTNLSICYSDAVWGTGDRQRHLMQTKLFKCECKRCKDVTEFGTNYSALKCKNSTCSGLILPESLETWNETWKCSTCATHINQGYVNNILEKSGADLSTMEKNIPNCLKYIEHYAKWLPSRHYHICEIKIQLSQKIGSDSKSLMSISNEELEKKLEYAKDLVNLYEIIAPCEARILGILCFEIHSAISEKTRRISLTTNVNTRILFEESLKFVEKAIEYLQHESDIFAEGLIYKQAVINRNAIKMIIKF